MFPKRESWPPWILQAPQEPASSGEDEDEEDEELLKSRKEGQAQRPRAGASESASHSEGNGTHTAPLSAADRAWAPPYHTGHLAAPLPMLPQPSQPPTAPRSL